MIKNQKNRQLIQVICASIQISKISLWEWHLMRDILKDYFSNFFKFWSKSRNVVKSREKVAYVQKLWRTFWLKKIHKGMFF